jgi:hypothetical protein
MTHYNLGFAQIGMCNIQIFFFPFYFRDRFASDSPSSQSEDGPRKQTVKGDPSEARASWLRHDVGFATMWASPRCGLRHDVGFATMWASPRCGLRHDVGFATMWASPRYGIRHDVGLATMWASPRCGLRHDVGEAHTIV